MKKVDAFQSAMELLLNKDEEALFERARKKGWECFQKLGSPTRKSEAFQYLKLSSILHENYAQPVDNEADISEENWIPESKGSRLLFHQGSYKAEKSDRSSLPSQVIILPLSAAVNTYGTLLNNQWNQTLKEEKDSFAALNLALHREGIFIYIPPKTILENPIHLLQLLESRGLSTIAFPRIHLFVGAHAEVTLVSTQKFLNSHSANNSVWHLAIEEGAHVNLIQESWEAPESCWFFEAVRATLKRDAHLTCTQATDGSIATRFDYQVQLLGENSEVTLQGLSLVREKQESHQHLIIEHHAPHCLSNQLFKSVLNDYARTSFEGKIFVHRAAQKTEAYQLNNNILLSDKAQAYSKPNLEIFADDVKASHGATIGHLDKEQEFYLRTRGLDAQTARSALIQGFCQEVIEKINIQSIREQWKNQVSRFFRAV